SSMQRRRLPVGVLPRNIVIFDPWCGCETKINVDLCERLDGFAISFRWGKPPRSQCSERILVETKPDGFDYSNNLHAAVHIKGAFDCYCSFDFPLPRRPRIKRVGIKEEATLYFYP